MIRTLTARIVRRSAGAWLRPRDEGGSILVLSLVLVVIIGVAGAAVLGQQSSAGNVQKAYSDVRTVQVTADALADSLIHGIRGDRFAGMSKKVNTVNPGLCSNYPNSTPGDSGFTNITAAAGSLPAGLEVWCAADPDSGALLDNAPEVTPYSIMTLGGQQGGAVPYVRQISANTPPLSAPTQSFSTGGIFGEAASTDGFGSQTPRHYLPFCDDYHDYQNSATADLCEAGLFVGRGVNDDSSGPCSNPPCPGGLLVASNGSLSKSPLVLSNSSIIVSQVTTSQRSLSVRGDVWARRDCGYGAGMNTAGFKDRVYAGYDELTAPTGNNADRHCANNVPWDNPYANALSPLNLPGNTYPYKAAVPLLRNPDFVHEPVPIDAEGQIDTTKMPIVNATPPAATCWNVATSLNNGSCGLVSNLCAHGFVPMPAAKVSTQNGVDVFAAVYNNAADLNAVMNACDDTLFWFRPGIYYFDFGDIDNGGKPLVTEWTSSKGCFPVNTCGSNPGSIVGGMPASTPAGPTWNTCNSDGGVVVVNCQQPLQVMVPEKADAHAWVADTTSGGIIDTKSARSLTYNGGNNADSLLGGNFQTPIPTNITTGSPTQTISAVTALKLEIAYALPGDLEAEQDGVNPNPAQWYASPQPNNNSNNYPTNYGPGAELQLTIPGVGSCYLHLDADSFAGEHMQIDRSSIPWHAVGDGKQVFNILNGCDNSDPTLKVEKVTGTFPSGPSTTANPLGNGKTFKNNPDWINKLKVDFLVKAATTTDVNHKAIAEVNGFQLVAAYKGRPAPQFPNGCDNTKPGVQFIFGNTSRISWGDSSSHSMFAELCASKQELFPNWTNTPTVGQPKDVNHCLTPSTPGGPQNLWGPCAAPVGGWVNADYRTGQGHELGIAVYGLSPDTSMPDRALDTSSNTPPGGGTSFYTYDNGASTGPGQAPWTNPDGSVPTPSRWSTNDGNVVSAVFTDHTKDTADLTMNMPSNLVGDGANQIPAGSIITNVNATVYHREGDVPTTGTGACAVPSVTTSWRPVPTSCPLTNKAGAANITGTRLQIRYGSSGAYGTNGFKAAHWNSDNSLLNAKKGIPTCTSFDGSNPGDNTLDGNAYTASQTHLQRATVNGVQGNACPFTWGNRKSTFIQADATGEDWTVQRDLTDSMTTPEALQNAQVIWTVKARANAPIKQADLDAVILKISYRPAPGLRPLRGCLTTRAQWPNGVPADPTDATNTTAAVGFDWLDPDWGADNRSHSLTPLEGDQAFGNFSGTSGGSGDKGDTSDCPLINLNTASQIKLHVQGTIYAPSAALALTANDNDAPWATAAIVSRQLSALRWINNGSVPSVGAEPPPRRPRKVTVEVRCGPPKCSSTKVLLRTVVEYDDANQLDIGRAVQVDSWIRNPS